MKIELTKEETHTAIAEYIYNSLGKEVIKENITMKYTISRDDIKDYSFICETNE